MNLIPTNINPTSWREAVHLATGGYLFYNAARGLEPVYGIRDGDYDSERREVYMNEEQTAYLPLKLTELVWSPTVGMPATIQMYSDKHAATVIAVTDTTIVVQRDIATRVDENGMSESQKYTFERDPHGMTITFKWGKRGLYSGSANDPSSTLKLGERREWYDFSF